MVAQKTPQSQSAQQRRQADTLFYPLPFRTRQAFEKHRNKAPQNPGLLFERFLPDSTQPEAKRDAQQLILEAARKIDRSLLQAFNARWQQQAEALDALPFTLKTEWRLVCGLGRKGPLEVGFTFHRYGFPIIPGSSLKGVARAYAFYQVGNALGEALHRLSPTTQISKFSEAPSAQKDKGPWHRLEAILTLDNFEEYQRAFEQEYGRQPEAEQLADQFRLIFGTLACAGRAIFLDAIPTHPPTLEWDIMNPHYPKYYSGEEYPTNWQSPVPVHFLVVASQTEFRFAIGWRGAVEATLQTQAQNWLVQGLNQLGVGAKTSAGYGYFQSVPAEQPAQPAGQSAEGTATPLPSQSPSEPDALSWRSGIIREYQPSSGWGRLLDEESGQEWRFDRSAIEEKNWSPGKKSKVFFALGKGEHGEKVIRIKRR
jgi:CRISPR-associated protein Cmr6